MQRSEEVEREEDLPVLAENRPWKMPPRRSESMSRRYGASASDTKLNDELECVDEIADRFFLFQLAMPHLT